MTPLPEGLGDTIFAAVGIVAVLICLAAYYGPSIARAIRER